MVSMHLPRTLQVVRKQKEEAGRCKRDEAGGQLHLQEERWWLVVLGVAPHLSGLVRDCAEWAAVAEGKTRLALQVPTRSR